YNLFLALMYLGLANSPIKADPAATPAHQGFDKWIAHRDSGGKRVDHGYWRAFLAAYLDTTWADGIHRVRYGRVPKPNRAALENYVASLQSEAVSALNRREQLAYWINLYNAMTVA